MKYILRLIHTNFVRDIARNGTLDAGPNIAPKAGDLVEITVFEKQVSANCLPRMGEKIQVLHKYFPHSLITEVRDVGYEMFDREVKPIVVIYSSCGMACGSEESPTSPFLYLTGNRTHHDRVNSELGFEIKYRHSDLASYRGIH